MESLLFDRGTACSFTGHRPDRLPSGWRQEASALSPLRRAMDAAIGGALEDGYRTFLCGMALGTDILAAELVLGRRERGQSLRLIAALPCPGQDSRWSREQQARYRRLLSRADGVQVLCDRYTPYCMAARNRWMVEHSARLIAVYDGGSGGTAGTVSLARRQGLEMVTIDPRCPEYPSPQTRTLFHFSE